MSPFYLNDFANMYVENWRWWLFIDYVFVKIVPLSAILWLIMSGRMCASEFGLTGKDILPAAVVFLIATIAGTVIDQNGYTLMKNFPGYSALGKMPAITDPFWDWIDLTLGLFFVAVVEELVFRGFMRTFIGRFTHDPLSIVIISSFAFGLIHWSLGLHAVLITAVIGAVFMFAYLKHQSLIPLIFAHFMVNFIDFAGVIPKSIFTFI